MHYAAKGIVKHVQAIKLLPDEIGSLAAQCDPVAAQIGLEFIERGLDL